MDDNRPLNFLQSFALERRQRQHVDGDGETGKALPAEFADFVLSFRCAPWADASELENVATRLARVGLDVEIRQALHARHGELEPVVGQLLIFVSCPRARLENEWNRSRLQDWLGGMVPLRRTTGGALEVDPDAQDDPSRLLDATNAAHITPAERQRLVHRLITAPESDGGAAIATAAGVDAVVALHDRRFNQNWLRHWAAQWLIDRHDLRRIREHFGDEIALYFAFLQSYVLWLALPAVAGLVWWAFGRSFSWQFGALLVLWGVAFTETWARREADIATYWGVHGVDRARETRRAGFQADSMAADPVTGERVPTFSGAKRWMRRLLGVPVIAALSLLMAAFITLIFALQTFLNEYYAGPFATLLGLTPVVLFSACLPAYTAVCTRVASALTTYENYEYEAEHAAQLTAKIFVFRFLQDQLYLFLTAWVFVPQRDAFGAWVQAAYDTLNSLPSWLLPLAEPGAHAGIKSSATPAAELVQNMLTSFIVTSQIVDLATETGLPLLLRWWHSRSLARASQPAGAVTSRRRHVFASVLAVEPTPVDTWAEAAADCDVPPADIQQQFVARVTEEVALPEYTTFDDYAEMASQFARVAFFSVAWPLAPLAALLNNWLELRTDAAKICSATRRPMPRRVETIGPWLDALRFMCWMSSITNALLVYQFHPNAALLPHADAATMQRFGRTSLSFALVVLLFSEHAFLAVRWAATHVMASWPGAYVRITERARAQSRRRWLERAPAGLRDLGGDGTGAGSSGDDGSGLAAELELGRRAIASWTKVE
ncbi:hypothetical protein LPJ70_000657 [Coemansia sp. RSA 2708]|nr:hypothetical protein LPJ70_000657 [Coemansia sp. RSA 2708]